LAVVVRVIQKEVCYTQVSCFKSVWCRWQQHPGWQLHHDYVFLTMVYKQQGGVKAT